MSVCLCTCTLSRIVIKCRYMYTLSCKRKCALFNSVYLKLYLTYLFQMSYTIFRFAINWHFVILHVVHVQYLGNAH